jgi:NTE family protein
MKWNPFNTNIGLALGGGAARGIAHVGVLAAIEEQHIDIACISGTSVGALVGSYYAFGQPVDQILSIGSTLNLTKMINLTLKKGGLFSTKAIGQMVRRDLGDCNIEDAKIPLAICATDIETGEQVLFRHGNLADAICASMAVPGLFVPVVVGGQTLVDGGIVENVPVSALETMGAGILVAVSLTHSELQAKPADMMDVVSNAIDIAMGLSTRQQLKKADIVISLKLGQYSRTNNQGRTQELFRLGYDAMLEHIPELNSYSQVNVGKYLAKVISEVAPFKVPEFIHKHFR